MSDLTNTRQMVAGEKHRLMNNYSSPAGLSTFWSILTIFTLFLTELTGSSKEAYNVEQHDIPASWEQRYSLISRGGFIYGFDHIDHY